MAGGGSGGHVTPVSAVITEVKRLAPESKIVFWTDFKFYGQAKNIIHSANGQNIKIRRVLSGKFRRYAHFKLIDYLKHPSITLLNIRDFFLFILGVAQSLFRFIFYLPDVIFLKGGYVCLPIGLAARVFRIPFIIHDSDSTPGLANRVLSRHAVKITTGTPLENYSYPKDKSIYVGIPISANYQPVSSQKQADFKQELGFDPETPLTVITGGGLGSEIFNTSSIKEAENLVKFTNIALVAPNNSNLEVDLPPSHFKIFPFMNERDMALLLSAADLVVARAGATTIAELAALSKPAIIIPAYKLSSGHQTKNAKLLESAGAVYLISDQDLESSPEVLTKTIKFLLESPETLKSLSKNLAVSSKSGAAEAIAKIILSDKI